MEAKDITYDSFYYKNYNGNSYARTPDWLKFFDNISDVNSIVMLDSLSYLRIERDFGDFDSWQEDFIACALASRGGWAMMVYSIPNNL